MPLDRSPPGGDSIKLGWWCSMCIKNCECEGSGLLLVPPTPFTPPSGLCEVAKGGLCW